MIGVGLMGWRGRAATAPAVWTPDLLPGRILDWDAERGPVVVAGRVTSEIDQSGAGNDALSLDTASDQPIMSTAPGLLGRASVYYGGTAYQRTALDVLPSAYTIFWVGQPDTESAQVFFATGATGGGDRVGQGISGPTIEDWIANVTFSSTDVPATADGLSLVYSTQDGPTPGAQLIINGAAAPLSDADTAALAREGAFIFGAAVEGLASGLYFSGHRCRLIVCSGRALPGDIAQFSAWTLAQYGK